MNDPLTVFIGIAIAFVIVGCVATVALIWFGYWMGRNSRELPVRSIHNPKKRASGEYVPPTGEPSGDLFNDAAFGDPGAGEPDRPTIGVR